MSDEELRDLEQSLLRWIASKPGPVAHDDLLEWARKASFRYSPALVRRVVWRLVSEDKLEFTPEWHLVTAD